jgi:hypothetical protein
MVTAEPCTAGTLECAVKVGPEAEFAPAQTGTAAKLSKAKTNAIAKIFFIILIFLSTHAALPEHNKSNFRDSRKSVQSIFFHC